MANGPGVECTCSILADCGMRAQQLAVRAAARHLGRNWLLAAQLAAAERQRDQAEASVVTPIA